jgi:hypothetical protein
MPELGTYGSVRGAPSNGRPYRDSASHPPSSSRMQQWRTQASSRALRCHLSVGPGGPVLRK